MGREDLWDGTGGRLGRLSYVRKGGVGGELLFLGNIGGGVFVMRVVVVARWVRRGCFMDGVGGHGFDGGGAGGGTWMRVSSLSIQRRLILHHFLEGLLLDLFVASVTAMNDYSRWRNVCFKSFTT